MRSFLFFFCLMLVFSCNKERRFNKDLQGKWNLTMVRFQDLNGFSFFDYAPEGNIDIDPAHSKGLLISNFNSFQGLMSDTLQWDGNYEIKLASSEINWCLQNDTLKNRLFVLTKTNLEIEYFNAQSNQRFRYVFNKIK